MRILHLVDEHMTPLDFDVLAGLQDAGSPSPTGRESVLAALNVTPPACLRRRWPRVHRLGFPARNPLVTVPWIRRLLRTARCDLVHAWGPRAAAAVVYAGAGSPPAICTVTTPRIADGALQWLARARHRQPVPLACSSEFIRSRFADAGWPQADLAVVRPGFAADRRPALDRDGARERLGLDSRQPVLLTCPPPSRDGGEYFAVWATALLEQVYPDVRLILPGVSPERERLRRFVRAFAMPHLYMFPDAAVPFDDLLPAADLCIAAPCGPFAVTPVARAMTAGVPLVATSVPAVTELLTDGQTASLCEPGKPTVLASRIWHLLRDRPAAHRQAEAARLAARELFDLCRMQARYLAAYDNMARGQRAFESS